MALLLAALAVAVGLSLAFGSRPIPLDHVYGEIATALAAGAHPELLDPASDAYIIAQLRIPRTALAILVGAALGVAGTLIQGHTRNPLADPSLLGISAGAAFAVVLVGAAIGPSSMWVTMLVAFGGALAATALVFALTTASGGAKNPMTIILGGAALAAVLQALTSAIVLLDNDSLNRLRFWVVGSVAGHGLEVTAAVAPVIAVALAAGLATTRQLNLLSLGDDVASSLGVNTTLSRWLGMLLIAVLAAAATAAAGPIAFVGLMVPHLARALTGPDYRWIAAYSALAGAAVLLLADVVGRVIARPGELQVGITLAFVGAPFMLWLLSKRKLVRL
ncbi:iron ABC transporter permease [Corynebacterium atypicum]|uniref:Iron ABC transporter permease n=1 Tax=Corynebacterium atypicum TaxID=191610 RepID=A0ABN4DEM7_9CORY|nr:iron ABC transporter permease [Corynebacterium atypicum]